MDPADDIFLSALEIHDRVERAAYLADACGKDHALQARVESLLLDAREAEYFFETAEGHPGAGEAILTEKPGTLIGRYKLLEKIGEGGMGVVYMAEQHQPVRRRVALKVIKAGMDTRQVVARFEAERQALALMDHPNIAKVLDGGVTDSGRPYFVMELVEGIPMTRFCEANKFSTGERLKLFIAVCQAIQSAHQKGIIHRDIKPSNVLVTIHDGLPHPIVIDFGVARATNQQLTETTLFTNFGAMLGTPAYMSPEQAEMSKLDVDTRSDIYSLGVLLYELLTGTTPFPAERLRSVGYGEMQRIIAEEEPERPSTRLKRKSAIADPAKPRIANRKSKIENDLDWIVMKCLEKDRNRRYATANGLATDIKRHLDNEPVLARPPSRLYEFQKTVRRHKFGFAATAAVMIALGTGVIASAWQAIRATRAERMQSELRQQAEVRELVAREKAYASDMNLLQQALSANNLGRARELLNRQRPEAGKRDLRGWEWRYLWQHCQSDALFTLCQKSNSISALSVSHDGKWLAIGEFDKGGLSVWNLESWQEVISVPAGEGHVRVAFSPRELLLAFSSESGLASGRRQTTVGFWDGSSKKTIARLNAGAARCNGLAFSDDGRRLVTSLAAPDNELIAWSVPDGRKLARFRAPQPRDGSGTPFAVQRDLRTVAYGMAEGQVCVVDLATGHERWRAPTGDDYVKALAFSPDGTMLVSSSGYGPSPLLLWDVATGKEIGRLEDHRGWVAALALWPDGKTLVSASADQTIGLWDLTTRRKLDTLRGHSLEVWRLALLPDNKTLVSGCKDGSVKVWDTGSVKSKVVRITLPGTLAAWRFAPDSKSVFALDRKGRVTQSKGKDFRQTEALLNIDSDFFSLWTLISRDGRLLAAGSSNGTVRVWDLQRRTLVKQFSGPPTPCPWEFLGHGTRLVIASLGDDSLHEWDLNTGHEMQSWRGAADINRYCSAAISPDEQWCLTLGSGTASSLKNLVTGRDIDSQLNVNRGSGAVFSADGKLFAAASASGYARIWETASLNEVATFRDFRQAVHSVAFSPDGKRLATGSDGKEAVKLWNVESQQELLTLEGQGSSFFRTEFSPDGNTLGSMNEAGVLHLWHAPSWEEIADAERIRTASR